MDVLTEFKVHRPMHSAPLNRGPLPELMAGQIANHVGRLWGRGLQEKFGTVPNRKHCEFHLRSQNKTWGCPSLGCSGKYKLWLAEPSML